MKGWNQWWFLEGVNSWVRNFWEKHSRQREEWVPNPWVGIDFHVPRHEATIFLKPPVQFSLGSVCFISEPRCKPICMAGLNNLMNSDLCAWALRMSSTPLDFVYLFILLNVICIWNMSSIDLKKKAQVI